MNISAFSISYEGKTRMFMSQKKKMDVPEKSYKNRLTHIIHLSHVEKLTFAQPVEVFLTVYGILMFIALFT
jgi:hypothetical protein